MKKSVSFMATTFVLLQSNSYAQTSKEVLTKMKAAIASDKTYQAIILMSTDAGKAGKMQMQLDLKTEQKKMALKITPIGQATGQMAMAAAMTNSQMYDDGITMYQYMPAQKMYRKRPSTGGSIGLPMDSIVKGDINKLSTAFKVSGTENVAGKACTVLVSSSPKNAQGQSGVTKLYVDKATYHFKQLVMEMSGAGPQGPNTIKTTMVVKSESSNMPINPSVFKFVPPAGSKEAPEQPQGGAPGMGAPGRKKQ